MVIVTVTITHYLVYIPILHKYMLHNGGPGWLNELGSWIT